MGFNWETCSSDTKEFIFNLQKEITKIINDDLVGFYIHGSLAIGGFNPNRSDIDVLVVTENPITVQTKRELAKLFVKHSNSPYPVEISFLNSNQLKDWKHPCPFDFHYSEFWRDPYEKDLLRGTHFYLNKEINIDPDLAAHITITNNRGICIVGKPIVEAFPSIPQTDYITSIIGDFKECIENIEEDPIYCTLNLIRVFCYLKEGIISSKQESGDWGMLTFPEEFSNTVKKVAESYAGHKNTYDLKKDELVLLRDYISDNVQNLLNS